MSAAEWVQLAVTFFGFLVTIGIADHARRDAKAARASVERLEELRRTTDTIVAARVRRVDAVREAIIEACSRAGVLSFKAAETSMSSAGRSAPYAPWPDIREMERQTLAVALLLGGQDARAKALIVAMNALTDGAGRIHTESVWDKWGILEVAEAKRRLQELWGGVLLAGRRFIEHEEAEIQRLIAEGLRRPTDPPAVTPPAGAPPPPEQRPAG